MRLADDVPCRTRPAIAASGLAAVRYMAATAGARLRLLPFPVIWHALQAPRSQLTSDLTLELHHLSLYL